MDTNLIIPNIVISNIPVVKIEEISHSNCKFKVGDIITASATLISDNKHSAKRISEENNEFSITYSLHVDNDHQYWKYDECDGIIRLGYIGETPLNIDTRVYIPTEVLVQHLAIYRLIELAKTKNADAVLETTITTDANIEKDSIIYKTITTTKIVKINTP